MTNPATNLTTTIGRRTRSLAGANTSSMNTTRSRAPDLHRTRTLFTQAAVLQLLADTLTLRDLYAKHAEQAKGPLSCSFVLICHRHRIEHTRLAELLAAYVRRLSGEALVMSADIAATTRIPRPPRSHEPLEMQIQRLLGAHASIAEQAIALVKAGDNAAVNGLSRDEITLVASELLLTGKLHVWLLAEHRQHVSDATTAAHAKCIAGRLTLSCG